MKKELKDQLIDSLCEEIKAYPHLYIADIGGLNSVQTSKLRRLAFRREVKLEVVKNTLLIKAMEKSGFDYSELFPVIKGESAIMLSNTNNAPAKLIKDYRAGDKNVAKPVLKGAYVEECFYIGEQHLDELVSIKSKNELVADVVALLQSPIKNVISQLQSGGNTISGVLKTLEEREA